MPDVWTRSHGCIAGVLESLQPAQRTHSAARTSRAPTPHPARSWRAQADSRTTSWAWKICGSVVSSSPVSRARSSSPAARLISTTGLRMVVRGDVRVVGFDDPHVARDRASGSGQYPEGAGGAAATERLLAAYPDVDGIFAASDLMAAGGGEVPADHRLVGE